MRQNKLKERKLNVRVVDCYCINPVDKNTLLECLNSTKKPTIVTVEDHYTHGGLGDFIAAALSQENHRLEKMAVTKISQSGTKDELLKDAGIECWFNCRKS
jgi:transketolase